MVDGRSEPDGGGRLAIARGIEVGHVFQLGRKYSEAMNATVLDEQGRDVAMHMGCYGIGVTRIVAAAIEQNHDERGIIWPAPLAPFDVVLVGLNWEKSEARARTPPTRLYRELGDAGIEVLLDDRDARPGVKFADAELIGIPHRVVVSERGLAAGKLEYRHRRAEANEEFPGRRRSTSCASASRPDEKEPRAGMRHRAARGRGASRPFPGACRAGRPPAGSGPARGHRRAPSRKRPASTPSTTTSCGSR